MTALELKEPLLWRQQAFIDLAWVGADGGQYLRLGGL
jgi:hypothetical protein